MCPFGWFLAPGVMLATSLRASLASTLLYREELPVYKENRKIPVIVAGIISNLEECLDAHWKKINRGGFNHDEQQFWSWIDKAMMTPRMEVACKLLDRNTHEYLHSLICDYNEAVFPRGSEREDQPLLFDLEECEAEHASV